MKLKIQLFASLRDTAKAPFITIEAADSITVPQLLQAITTQHPELEKWLPHCRLAIGEEYASPNQIVHEGDEIALIPPVSGGAGTPLVAVVEHELSLDEVVKAVCAEKGAAAGAICTFLGVVRENSKDPNGNAHNDIEFLDYEAYAPMAEREMGKIALEAAEQWDAACAVTHRIGRLGVGEASVAIAVATAHRAPSFEACRYIIEELKKRVPIWKKENARDGFWWSEGSGV